MKRSQTLVLVAVLGLAIVLAPPASAGRGDTFPSAGIDLVHHELQIAVHKINDDGSTGKVVETLLFKGRMLLERGDPFVNADQHRQINFLVKTWEAYAYSEAMETLVTYKLTPGRPQRLSRITAQNPDRDYPAEFYFNVTFDAVAYGESFFESQEGTPIASEFMEVPPSGNRRTSPTFAQFETTRIEMDHPQLGRLRFIPVSCNDTSGITLATFPNGGGERTLRPDAPAR